MEVNRCFGCMEETLTNPCPHCGYDVQTEKQQSFSLRPGTILYGKYLVGKVLGQGGFGITYIGWDLALSRKVAIKEFFPSSYVTRDSAMDSRLQWYITEEARNARSMGREMFLKEARKMNRVSSVENVVHVLELFEDNDTAYIIMEYIHGENLMRRVKENGPMPWQSVKSLLLPMMGTMQRVHDNGMVHRDLSPDNLMVQPDGSVKLLDLGAAKDMNLHSGASSVQVAKGGFSPLELYVQRGSSGAWTDVYSMTATMYYLLTGVMPPSAVDRMEKDTVRWDLPQLRKLPQALLRVMKRGMALHAHDRIQSMRALAEEIRKSEARKKTAVTIAAIVAAVLVPVVLAGVLIGSLIGKPDGERVSATESTAETQEQIPENTDESGMPWSENVLMVCAIPEQYRYDMDESPVFNSRIARYQIVTATFLDSIADKPADSWDVSQSRDGSVVAWTKENGVVSVWNGEKYVDEVAYDLYIAADGGINGKHCAKLFSGYKNMTGVYFNGCFHTDFADSMEEMFKGCYSLAEVDVSSLKTDRASSMRYMFQSVAAVSLDLSGFDTSNVTDMGSMFDGCSNLKSLDLRSFDTAKVTDMGNMFCLCSNLASLDISSFDTGKVEDMSFMFSYLDLDSLDLGHFNTQNVTVMSYMFSGSDQLTRINLKGFDTAKVTRMSGMFQNCKKLVLVEGIEDLDTSSVESYDGFMDEGVLINGSPWENMFQ